MLKQGMAAVAAVGVMAVAASAQQMKTELGAGEGTVTEVEAVPGAAQDRITVEVDRWIKPGKGEKRIVFPMNQDVDPRLAEGDHVLLGFPGDSAQPDTWTTKEAEIARERAWMEAALADAGAATCE